MNVYDAERMAELMDTQGYEQTENMDEADMVILNTCHIREKAAEKVYSELGRVRLNKQKRETKGKDTIIAFEAPSSNNERTAEYDQTTSSAKIFLSK